MQFKTWKGRIAPIAGPMAGAGIAAAAVIFTAGARPPQPMSLVCDAGGPYLAECNGPLTTVQLDGSGSFDPEGLPLTFKWGIECGSGVLDDPSSPTPILTYDMTGKCGAACGRVDLTITAGNQSSTCSASVQFIDSTPPTIVCPPDLVLGVGAPTDPIATGTATATDFCNPSPVITWFDLPAPLLLSGQGVGLITRIWTADDGCQQASCVQTITIARYFQPHVDIEPGLCPNPFLPSAPGPQNSMQLSIVGNEFDVAEVNVETLRLLEANFDLEGGEVDWVAPTKVAIVDTATPFIGPECGCHTLGPDGLDDLDMEFDAQTLTNVFKLASRPPGTVVKFEIHGKLMDGRPFIGKDCIVIQ